MGARKLVAPPQFPSPEIAAKENAHVERQIQISNVLRRVMTSDNEEALREIFDDSQTKLEFVDNLSGEIREEVERETREEIFDRLDCEWEELSKDLDLEAEQTERLEAAWQQLRQKL